MKNKKAIILIAGVLLSCIISFACILLNAGTYTARTNIFTQDSGDQLRVEAKYDRNDIAELTDYYIKDGELRLEFRALNRGEVHVSISHSFYKNVDMIKDYDLTLDVGMFNVIVDKTNGRISFSGYFEVINSIIGSLLFVEFIMLLMFAGYCKRGKFGYPMIVCGGASIYIFVLMLFLIYKMLNNVMNSFSDFIFYVSEIGIMLLLALIPVMLILSVLLAASNIWLIRHEGRRPVNTLGILFGVLWFAANLLTVGTRTIWITSIWRFENGSVIDEILVFLTSYFECMFLSTVVCSFLSTKYRTNFDRDYIIILGCGIRKDGTLTPLLKGRVDSAINFAKAQEDKTGKKAVFVPSGGQGSDEIISESEAMSRYLISQNIPESLILKEDKSTTTFENMKFSKQVIEENGGDISEKKIAFATTNYHVFRGYVMAKKNGFDAKGISAKTKFYFYPNAFLREFVGLLADQKWKHIIAILVILAFFLSLNNL